MTEQKNRNDVWLKEYESFLNDSAPSVPESLSESVSARMMSLLDPSPWMVFGKVLLIHFFVGFVSLAFCHQFGVNPFNTSRSLDSWIMSAAGHASCMIACGVIFLGLSILAAGYFLSLEETRSLRNTGFPQTFALAFVSLGLFHMAGAELALTFAALWVLGALTGGFLATEIVWKLKYTRLQILQRAS